MFAQAKSQDITFLLNRVPGAFREVGGSSKSTTELKRSLTLLGSDTVSKLMLSNSGAFLDMCSSICSTELMHSLGMSCRVTVWWYMLSSLGAIRDVGGASKRSVASMTSLWMSLGTTEWIRGTTNFGACLEIGSSSKHCSLCQLEFSSQKLKFQAIWKPNINMINKCYVKFKPIPSWLISGSRAPSGNWWISTFIAGGRRQRTNTCEWGFCYNRPTGCLAIQRDVRCIHHSMI